MCSSLHVLVYDVFLTPCTGLWCIFNPKCWSVFLTPCTDLWCVSHPIYRLLSVPHPIYETMGLAYGMFLAPCTGLWCVSHPMYWSTVCFSPHILDYGVLLTPCTGLWCIPHPMFWTMVCSSPHVLDYGVFLTPCTGLWYWCMVCSSPHVLVYGVFLTPSIKENFTIKTVEIYYVIPSEVHDFKITPVSGMGLLKEYPGWEEVDNEVTRVKILFSNEMLEMQPATSTKGKELTSLNVPSCW